MGYHVATNSSLKWLTAIKDMWVLAAVLCHYLRVHSFRRHFVFVVDLDKSGEALWLSGSQKNNFEKASVFI